MEKLKGYLEVKKGEISGVASTQAVDRDGEVIMQSGWDLTNFNRNPVLMLMHNYQEFPIGKVTEIGITDGKLTFKAIFSEATDKAKEAYALVKEGILSAFSVGFIPREYDPNNFDVITRAELLEISLVPVPANPEAVVLAKQFQEKSEIARYIVKNFLVEKDVTEPEVVPVVEAPKEEVPAGFISHTLTEEDIKNNPEIGKVGDEVLLPIETEAVTPPAITPEVALSNEVGKESEKANEIDRKLIQATVKNLQDICRELNRKGGVNI